MGGIVAVLVADVSHLATPFEPMFIPAVGQVIESPLDFSAGKSFDFIGFAQEKGNYSFERKRSVQGLSIEDRLQITIPELSPEVHQWLYDKDQSRNIVIAVDNNGKAVIMGSSNYPTTFSYLGATGSGVGGQNQYTFNFECAKPYMSRFYLLNEIIPPDVPLRKVYDSGFDWGYLRTW